MRNPNRIKPFLKKLEEYWEKHPDLRFGQIIINMKPESKNPPLFFIEDEDFEKLIDKRNEDLSTS